jgi:antitoxin component YwqK of YwqJK toxin-antitoxin module
MFLNNFKIAVFCVFAGLSQVMFAQVAQPDSNFIDARGLRQGPWRVINPEGMSFEGQFKDGRPYGRFRHFDRFDRTITILEYFRDGFASKATHFHPNGNLRATGFYLERTRDSTWEIYDTEGRIVERLNYLDGMRHGLSELFDKDGILMESTEWYRDLRNGRWWQRTERGEQWTTYRNNLSHGTYEAVFANGNTFIRGYYEDGLKEETWYFYHENALLDRIIQFKNNRIFKKQIAINIDGQDILIDSDSVVYLHTNGRIAEIKMLDGTVYRPRQTFDQLVESFELMDFFLATSQFLAPYRMFDSFVLEPEDEKALNAEPLHDEEAEIERLKNIKGLLKLKVPTPYDVEVDGEVILMFQSATNPNPIIER